ncbi:tRNA (guanosine(46)-N7)-methyltransferase TrmB [Mycoplasmopsis anatis]|uniref:tRNA (guanine-N(7)-)-methyltransferase n=1 Tax=Mycoplasmopsis anatis TaxID=171279 RepID=A0A9Q3L7V8_9BACT|nr:tRNA (guanosine(46)-N7)-methyltransferase TrmB [Mycoplasmopsis anatis]MBW0595022.1 tRNA (guanosine(46)-N7)-methyltransferase TrmB [Mycoplasmopsis anatis]MBW0595759.1 tRNA (guanosine(46)-N7)-methyltransferase TrmB [Mycoplasmopsis anatis]MBW0596591.1 tRNA (guanosine(46)-N7)-methyltransferase TrmB [Mycoplasmopsis anatis]MBW0597318.1 tRNA (guanosine(46)-N7)-methyltransferase TrmB [Mycoplasmopsis anatis]MBW0599468.1 tRNA (guanosine(46)-N7)-methyltransferase TrmB [Mycoplasmopsis anatis]
MRIRNNPKATDILENCEFVIKNFPFTIKEDDVLEIGAGKGEMICKLAQLNPNIRYIAFEKFETIAAMIVKKINELELKNLYVICKDAATINELIKGQTNNIWLTFSDPWPKKRHAKRRLTNREFLKQYQELLTKNGLLKFKTDNDKLFEYSIEEFNDQKWDIINITNDLHNSEFNLNNIRTGYEQKFASIGKNINYLEAKKPNKI